MGSKKEKKEKKNLEEKWSLEEELFTIGCCGKERGEDLADGKYLHDLKDC